MITKQQIITKALYYLGNKDNDNPLVTDTLYDQSLNQLLLQQKWIFNISASNLTIVTDDNSYLPNFKYQYNLPANFGVIDEIYWNNQSVIFEYRIMNEFFLCNFEGIKLTYSKNSTTLTSFDDLFGDCLAVKIAYDYCVLIGRIQDIQRLDADYQRKYQLAITLNQKNQQNQQFNLTRYIDARN
jgi:hypothetical protein